MEIEDLLMEERTNRRFIKKQGQILREEEYMEEEEEVLRD